MPEQSNRQLSSLLKRELHKELLDLFGRYQLDVAVGMTANGVMIRSQDERVDASNLGRVIPYEGSDQFTNIEQLTYIEAVLEVCWEADDQEMVFWRPWPAQDGPLRAMVICSDWFMWASADAELIEPNDVPLLRSCLKDLQAVEKRARAEHGVTAKNPDTTATTYVGELFACRKRQMRPMGCIYTDFNALGPLLAELFDAAGPERTDSDGIRTSRT